MSVPPSVSGKNVNHIRLVMYLMFAPILFGALLVGTYLNPDKPSISFFLFLCTLPMAIIDNPWRIISYQMAIRGHVRPVRLSVPAL
jgi:hypothetical protein